VTDSVASGSGGTVGVGGRGDRRGLRDIWTAWRTAPEDRFGVLLFFVAMTIVVNSVVDVGASYGQSFLAHSMSAAALVAALRATGVGPRRRRVVEVVVLALVTVLGIIALVEGFTSLDLPEAARADPLWLVLVVAVPVLVIRRITRHTVVGMRTVAGAVAAYLEIAVAYAALFQAVDVWSSNWLFGQPETSSAYMYVSLTTISTLGIGDIVPATQTARLLVSAEAVLGQIFLVTVVAIVVARFAGERRPRPSAEEGG
jgi:hypothetical protein